MLTAAAVAMAGGAFAVPTVYDYKASVKHAYLKEVSVTINGATIKLYAKTQKSASLRGYLIQDTDADLVAANPGPAAITGAAGAPSRQPQNRAFLVVMNSSAEAAYRTPRILPAILEAKWWNPNIAAAARANAVLGAGGVGLAGAGSVTTEGYLYVGGEITAALAGGFDGDVFVAPQTRVLKSSNSDGTIPPANTLVNAIDDHFFTSCYLFGKFNQPNWTAGAVVPFADAWMNGAGFGKGKWDATACCGRAQAGWELSTLQGNLKAGLFLCSENGELWDHANNLGLDQQYWVEADPTNPTPAVPNEDIWADGLLDLGTTDVGFGTWSIKRRANFQGLALTADERAQITGAAPAWALAATQQGLATAGLMGYIKRAATMLKSDVTLLGDAVGDGSSGDVALINQQFYNNYLLH